MSGFGVEVGAGYMVMCHVGGWEGRLYSRCWLDLVVCELFAWLFGVYFLITHFDGCFSVKSGQKWSKVREMKKMKM